VSYPEYPLPLIEAEVCSLRNYVGNRLDLFSKKSRCFSTQDIALRKDAVALRERDWIVVLGEYNRAYEILKKAEKDPSYKKGKDLIIKRFNYTLWELGLYSNCVDRVCTDALGKDLRKFSGKLPPL
jgi:hypothetical protein